MNDLWIWVEKWGEFQTFQEKKGKPWAPPWIKVYHSLLDEPNYIALTPETRSLLEGIWKLFARTRGTLRKDTRNLSRQLNQRVTEQQLQRLNHAGWITFCSGTVLEQHRNAFWNRSTPDVEVDVEEEEINPSVLPTSSLHGEGRTEDEIEMRKTEAELADVDRDHYGVPLNGRTPEDDLAAELGLANILKDIPL